MTMGGGGVCIAIIQAFDVSIRANNFSHHCNQMSLSWFKSRCNSSTHSQTRKLAKQYTEKAQAQEGDRGVQGSGYASTNRKWLYKQE